MVIILIIAIVIIIFFIVSAIVNFFDFSAGSFLDFLFNTIWGIICVIVTVLSGLFFYASAKLPRELRARDKAFSKIKDHSNLPTKNMDNQIKTQTESGLTTKVEIEDNVLDLSVLDLDGLVKELAFAINKPFPIFFKGWGNQRLALDIQRASLIKDYISTIREAGKEFIDFKAEALISFDTIKIVTETKLNELNLDFLRSQHDIDLLRNGLKHEKKKQELEVKQIESDIAMINAQADRIKAEAEAIRQRSLRDVERANILKESVKYFKDLSPVLKAYVTTQLGSETPAIPSNDLEMQDALKDVIKRKQTAEARKIEAEATESEEMNEFLKWKHEREKNKRIGNT